MDIKYEINNSRFAFGGAEYSNYKQYWREKEVDNMIYRRAQLTVGILHWHESIEVCRLVSGEAVFTIEDKKYKFGVGDIVIIPGKSLHLLECEGDHIADVFLIPSYQFLPIISEYPTFASFISDEDIKKVYGLKAELDFLFDRIRYEFSEKGYHWQSIALSYGVSVIALLSRNFGVLKTQRRKNSNILEPVLSEIKNDCTNPEYSLSYFAKKLGYTTEYFSCLFKEYAGMGFKKYLDRQRIDEAKRIMIRRDISISDLAGYCGYNNVRTFNNRFKDFEKITPSQFQKETFIKNKDEEEII